MRINLKFKLILMTILVVNLSTIILGTIAYGSASKTLTENVNLRLTAISDKIALEVSDLNETELILLRSIAKLDFLTDPFYTLEEKKPPVIFNSYIRPK